MVASGEYHSGMGRLKSVLVAAFAAIVILAWGSSPASAQVNGVPPSVTSIGFGGHFDHFPGVPPSVTSVGPRGFNDPNHFFTGAFPPATPGRSPHHQHPGKFFPPGGYVAVPYPAYIIDPTLGYNPVDMGNPPLNDSAAPAENQTVPAGPTIFDRRASGQTSQSVEAAYAQRLLEEEAKRPAGEPEPIAAQATAAPVQDQPYTVLMFKDGHQLEVQNYAIVGSVLYDLTPGRRSRIPLSDLDLAATARENNERGIDFQMPAGVGLN